jgi:predicted N-formylglutamate amidohydrolase
LCPAFDALLLTCEHAGNRVPRDLNARFTPHAALLASHRGWDPGAFPIAEAMATQLNAPLISYKWTRLLIEPNRSLHHPALFSVLSRTLPAETKTRLIETYYRPHRDAVEKTLRAWIDAGRTVLHVGVHTFTPELDGEVRNADIGLLYDPASNLEREAARQWQTALHAQMPSLRIRRNYPYRGAADGLTTHLRRTLGTTHYAGMELEVNQALATALKPAPRLLAAALATSLQSLLR